MRIEYASEAIDDLEQIERYHAERAGAETAIRLVDRIRETIEKLLGRHPAAGRRRPEFGSEVRSLPIVPHIVFYRPEATTVVVQRILHGHRDVKPPLASLLVAV